MNFSDYYGIGISGHRDIDFVDVQMDSDVPLYIDPERITLSNHPFAARAAYLIDDFFSEVFDAASKCDEGRLFHLLSFGREPNETHLGLSTARSRGKGVSPEILMPVIQDIIRQKLLDRGLITQISDLPLWTPNFGPDRLSDLTTNIIREVLYDFSCEQFELLGIPVPAEETNLAIAWDPIVHDWCQMGFPRLGAGRYRVLLVPKCFVGRMLLSSPGELLQKYVLRYRQKEHLDAMTPLCHRKIEKSGQEILLPPTKTELKTTEIRGDSQKRYMWEIGFRHPEMMQELHSDHRRSAQRESFSMSDFELDSILYEWRDTTLDA